MSEDTPRAVAEATHARLLKDAEINQLDPDGLATLAQSEYRAWRSNHHDAVIHAINTGKALLRAKATLEHGEWLPWLKKSCRFSIRSAQDFMNLAKNPEARQIVTRLNSNTQHAALLPVSVRELKRRIAPPPKKTSEAEQHQRMLRSERPKPCPLALGNHSAAERFDHGMNMIAGVFAQCDPFVFEQFAGALRELLARHERQLEGAQYTDTDAVPIVTDDNDVEAEVIANE